MSIANYCGVCGRRIENRMGARVCERLECRNATTRAALEATLKPGESIALGRNGELIRLEALVTPAPPAEPEPTQTWRAATKYGVWLTRPPGMNVAPHWLGQLLPLSKGSMTLDEARAAMRNETWRQYGPELRVWLGPNTPGELVPENDSADAARQAQAERFAEDWFRPGTRVVMLDGGTVSSIEAVHGGTYSLRGFNKHFTRDELRPADDSAFAARQFTESRSESRS